MLSRLAPETGRMRSEEILRPAGAIAT